MRVANRICAFALALAVAFLSVGYDPPKAKAVVVESSIIAEANAVVAAYAASTGLTLGSSSAAAASAGTASLISGYAAATGATYEVVTTAIAAGTTISGGTIILGAAAVAVLAGIVAWAISEYGLQAGADPVPIAPSISSDLISCNGVVLPAFPEYDPVKYPYVCVVKNGPVYMLHVMDKDRHLTDKDKYFGVYGDRGAMVQWVVSEGSERVDPWDGKLVSSDGTFCYNASGLVWANYDVKSVSGAVYMSASQPVAAEDWDNPAMTATLDADYSPKPELAPEMQVRIDTGVSPELAPEAVPDAIFESIAGNEFAPTYVEEPVADLDPDPDIGGSDNPDDGTEEEPSTGTDLSGVLGWLESIWNAINSLVEAIGDKLMELFVPSEEYMEALPEALTDAFAERTGFLTYPTSLLFGFVDLIATPAGDFILEWDDVYEPFSRGKLISAGQFNVTQYVNSNQALSNVYSLWKTVVSGYLIFMFFDLCYKKSNAIVCDRLG